MGEGAGKLGGRRDRAMGWVGERIGGAVGQKGGVGLVIPYLVE